MKGSRCVWIGRFRGISRNLSDKLAVSMNAKEMDISREVIFEIFLTG